MVWSITAASYRMKAQDGYHLEFPPNHQVDDWMFVTVERESVEILNFFFDQSEGSVEILPCCVIGSAFEFSERYIGGL